MFNSGITVSSLIDGLRDEVDIALPIPDSSYVDWLNALEQILYSEFIKEQYKIGVATGSGNVSVVDDIDCVSLVGITPSWNAPLRFEDVYAVYADGVQLIKSTVASGVIFPNTYFKKQILANSVPTDVLAVNAEDWDKLEIVCFIRPKLKTVANKAAETVSLPIEFMELVKSKLRGEAYKLANEDTLAAKWLGSYNALLEDFTAWLQARAPQFGV